MNRLCYKFLAGACLAGDQYGHIGGCNLIDLAQGLADFRRLSNIFFKLRALDVSDLILQCQIAFLKRDIFVLQTLLKSFVLFQKSAVLLER
jgi:hypothetical protein